MSTTLLIPQDTVKRLFLYHRSLVESRQTDVISSEEMARLTGCSAAQIRKDLSFFGQFGTPGKGYDVARLAHQIKSILGIDREWEMALIGLGNLGRALSVYSGLKLHGFRISQLFDNDPLKIGKPCAGLKIKDVRTLKEELAAHPVKIAVLTLPANQAQMVVNLLVESGVRAILNFAPTRVTAPEEVKILNLDVVNQLARLTHYLTRGSLVIDDRLESDPTSYTEGNEVY